MNKNSLRIMVLVGLLSVTASYAAEQQDPVTNPVVNETSSFTSTLNTIAQPGQYVASKVAEAATKIAGNTNAAIIFEAVSITGLAYIIYNLFNGTSEEEENTY